MKRIVLILLLSFAYVAQAQYLAPMNAKNSGSWSIGLLRIDSSFNLRLFDTAVTKLAFPSNLNNRWARQGQRLYVYNGSYFELADNVPAIDTSNLSARINARVKYTDTAAMLVGYVRAARLNDTALAIRSAIPNVSGKVNYSDTAAMLSPYLRKADTTAMLSKYLRKADTTAMLLPYARKTLVADTAAAIRASIPNVSGKVNYTDTAAMLSGYVRANRLSDTASAIRSSIPNVSGKVNYTDTASMLAPYATDAQVALKLNIADTANMRIRPIAGSNMTISGTYPNVTFAASGGTVIDTTSLSNRIDARVKYTDTAAMLGGYLRKVDTSTLSNRINAKLSIADTATMLTNYARKTLVNDTAAAIRAAIPDVSGKVNYTDTASMLSPYLRSALGVKYADTASMLGGYLLKADTSSLSNRINLKFNTADTANKWVNSVTKLNDSTIRVIKNTTITDITLTPASTVTSATRLITAVYNKSGATITKGSVVYINGAHSSVLPSIALAKANTESTSAYTYGLVENDIPNNSQGVVIQVGVITNLNLPTSTYTDGQTLYLSPTVAGGYTLIKPLAPNHYVSIGTITRAHPTLGTIQIAIRNGFQLDELSDVKIPLVPNDSDLLQFTRVDSLWKNVSVTTAIGNKYIKPSDTAVMLTPYLRKVDTASLSARINLKLNSADTSSLSTRIDARVKYSDTASMLSPYYRTATATAALATKLNISDTATMLGSYLRKVDTSSLSNRINLKLNSADTASLSNRINLKLNSADTASLSTRIEARVKYTDTATMLSPYYRTATATAALATKVNYTDTATMLTPYLRKGDTASMLTAYARGQRLIDTAAALQTRINAKVGYGTLTTNYVPKATSATAIGNSQIFDNGTSVGIGTITPNASAELDIVSTTQGLGLPSMTTTQKNAIAIPRTGLQVYDNTLNYPEFYNGSVWTSGWNERGNAGTNATNDFIGTTDDVDLVFRRNNTRAGWLNGALSNTSFGVLSMPTTATGSRNTAFGFTSLSVLSSGTFNTAVGDNSMRSMATGTENVAIGYNTLGASTAASENVAIGARVLESNTGNRNTAVGDRAMLTNTTGGSNCAYGYSAGYSNLSGSNNCSFGLLALVSNSTSSSNSAFGDQSLNRTTGAQNTGIGAQSAYWSTTGSNNTSVGFSSSINLSTGANNTTLGTFAGRYLNASSNNVYLGYGAGDNFQHNAGDKNLLVGYNAFPAVYAGSNQLNLGNVLWGSGCSGTGQTAAGSLSIGVTAPDASAILDLTSTTKGLLLPRMTTTQINAIASPAAGLTVYNTTLALICFYNGTAWQKVTATAM